MVKAYTQETTLGEKYETDSAGIGRTNRSAGFMEKISDTKYIYAREIAYPAIMESVKEFTKKMNF